MSGHLGPCSLSRVTIPVFDEATGVLEDATEVAVVEAIEPLAGTRTIVVIARRLMTRSARNVVRRLDADRFIRTGTYNPVASPEDPFRHCLERAG